MSGTTRFNLLVVRSNGTRVVRLSFPRGLVYALLGIAGLATIVLTLLVVDYVQLRHLTREAVTFRDQIGSQRAIIDAFNRGVADLRREMATWRDLHARIWEPFGPGPSPRYGAGIGGGSSRPLASGAPSALDELQELSETVLEAGASLQALDRLIGRAGKALASLPSRWPVRGSVSSEFGARPSLWSTASEHHSGIDIGARRGTPLVAPAAGVVAFAGAHQDFGLALMVDHGNEVKTVYGHLSRIGVAAGARIERGAVIGWTGNTGRSSGPHLHYEILVNGRPVNPRAYLWD